MERADTKFVAHLIGASLDRLEGGVWVISSDSLSEAVAVVAVASCCTIVSTTVLVVSRVLVEVLLGVELA